MIQAPPKTGKSMFAAQMVDALDLNHSFLVWTPERAWKCLYIQVDAPSGDWHAQLDQLGLTSAYTLDRADLGLFFLDDSEKRLALRDVIKQHGFEFVVWDAAEKLSGTDLNKKDGCQLLLRYLHEVWTGPCAVIHHPRKLSEGSSWRSVDEVAGHHYLAADASAIITLRGRGREGYLNVIGRRAESRWEVRRDPETYAWIDAVPESDESFR